MSVHIYSDFKPGQKVRQDNAIPTYDGVVKDLEGVVFRVHADTDPYPIEVLYKDAPDNCGNVERVSFPYLPNELIIIKEA